MSSIRDIMDVDDIEPLEAQAHRRSRASAQQQEQTSTHIPPLQQLLQPDIAPEPPLKRRRSDPVPPDSPINPMPNLASSQPFAPAQPMPGYPYDQSFAQQQAGSSSGDRRSSRASAETTDSSVRLTPVTGRVSRAKKGHPVHVCQLCDPPKTFTRAEHLRRHQLGHDQPKYRCTFEGCEKAFHRRDLLTRHMLRHESGEKSLRPDSRTRSPDSFSESQGSPPAGGSGSAPSSSKPSNETSHQPSSGFSGYGGGGGTAPPESSSRGAHMTHQAGLGPESSFAPTPVNRQYPEDFPNFNPNHVPTDSIYSNSADLFSRSTNNVVGLGLYMPDAVPPGLSQIKSSFLSSANTWLRTPSEVARFDGAYQSVPAPFDRAVPEWDCQSSMWPYGHYARPEFRNTSSDMGQYEPTSYPSPPFSSPPPASYPTVEMSSPNLGFQMASVGLLPFTRAQDAIAQTSSVLTPPNQHEFSRSYPEPVVWMGNMKTVFTPHREFHTAPTEEQLNSFLDSFFEHVEPNFPITHAGIIDQPNEMLRNAMAALGAQFTTDPEDRQQGARLYDSCRRMMAQVRGLSVQTMQAIVLSEVFARYHARRIDIGLSSHFKVCSKNLVQSAPEDSTCIFRNLKAVLIDSEIERRLALQVLHGDLMDRQQVLQGLWCEWIQYETRQRLRSACFIIDIYQQRFYEQERYESDVGYNREHLVLPCSDELWNAANSVQWYDNVCQADYSSISLCSAEALPSLDIAERSRADKLLILCSLSSHFPITAATATERMPSDGFEEKIISLSPYQCIGYGYLALSYTPLHQLLALTGSTYVSRHKMASHKEVDQVVPSIKKWSSSPAAAHAAWHACQVLNSVFSSDDAASNGNACNYWAIYTSALICWAFGHRASKRRLQRSRSAITMPFRSCGSSRAKRQQLSRVTTSFNSEGGAEGQCGSGVPLWVQIMLERGPEEMTICPERGDTNAMLCAVKTWLAGQALQGKGMCGRIWDACGVLQRLVDGDITF